MNITPEKGPGRSAFAKNMATASLIVFGISLTQHGYYTRDTGPYPGWGMLIFGWFGMLDGVFAWLGNPLLLTAWLFFLLEKNKLSAYFSFAAFFAMLEFLLTKTFSHSSWLNSDQFMPNHSGDEPLLIVGRGTAYWLWLSSSALMMVSSVSALLFKKEKPHQPLQPPPP
jgi:hypothetical protein